MKLFKNTVFASSLVILAFASCKKDHDIRLDLVVPSTYSSANYTANAAEELVLRSSFKSLVDTMKLGNNVANKLNATNLQNMYEAGSPSMSNLTNAYYRGRITAEWFPEIANASQNTFDPFNLNTTGGVYGGTRLLNPKGVESIQLVEKGLFSSMFFRRLIEIMYGNPSAKDVDRLICLVGAHPDFSNSTNATKVTNPDVYLAAYIARRDKADGNGFYTNMAKGFIKLKAAIEAGSEYNTEKDEARTAIRENIEKGLMATVVNYTFSAITKLSGTNPDDDTRAAAFHDLGENIGFVHGLLGIDASKRKASDAQLNQMLNLLHAPSTGEGSVYLFATQPTSELQKLTDLIALIKSVYAFSDSQIEDFKQNWVSVQGR